ncbi:unnamed protein product, partial [Angiostrongylus costaricensis]|uniref:Major sperm protein n=1 Tax=Angiostrongylus costaricensis TaxID=334426 RepID=A0A0R3Q0J6_ANGCS
RYINPKQVIHFAVLTPSREAVSVPVTKPNEPEFKMTITPVKVIFQCTAEKKPVWTDVKLTNPMKDKQSYKVKCTSADIFRAQPPLGFIKPGETGTIRMWFQNKEIPEGHRHYFAIYHIKCPEGKTVKEIWTKNVNEGDRRLPFLLHRNIKLQVA